MIFCWNLQKYAVKIIYAIIDRVSGISKIRHCGAGAMLAMGRGGRETTLWPVQKEFFDKKLAIFGLQTNLKR